METLTSDTTTRPTSSTGPSLRVGVVAGSTRPTRRSLAIARWVAQDTTQPDLDLVVVDLAEQGLPLLSEPTAAAFGRYEQETTRAWAATVGDLDAVVLVVPEYNASFPAVLKNALDHLYAEWADKPVAFVGYGMAGGVRAVEQLRLVASELHMVGLATPLALFPHQVVDGTFQPTKDDDAARASMFAGLARLGRPLQLMRTDGH